MKKYRTQSLQVYCARVHVLLIFFLVLYERFNIPQIVSRYFQPVAVYHCVDKDIYIGTIEDKDIQGVLKVAEESYVNRWNVQF